MFISLRCFLCYNFFCTFAVVMILDVVRHKFAEALLALLLLALSAMVAAMCDPALPEVVVANAAPLRPMLHTFAVNHHILAALIILPLFCSAALRFARATIRISLYPESTMAAIAIAAVVLLAMTSGGEAFALMIIAFLMCYSLGRLLGCFGPSMRAQRLFSAMLAVGCMPLIDSSLLALVIVIPLLLIFVRRTLRESIISIVGAILPLFAYSYIAWCLGDDFTATAIALWNDMLTPAYGSIATYITLPRMVFVVMLVVMQLSSSAIYISDRMSLGPGVRHAWSFLQLLFALLVLLALLLPSASSALFVVATLPVIAMLPLLLMRVPAYLSTLLFFILLSCSYIILILNILA